jgi:hypothetical protein
LKDILIYTPKKTNRLQYVFNHLLGELLGLTPLFIHDNDAFAVHTGPKINYSWQAVDDEFFVMASDLLFERGIVERDISFGEYSGEKCFFLTYNKKSAYPFDLFAATFYLLSRYEEYLPFIKDKYGRFDAEVSMAYAEGFLRTPLVNIWALDLGDKLQKAFPELEIKKPEYRFIPTIDVDAAFAYREKGTLRTLGGYLKDLRRLDFAEIRKRTRVLTNKEPDPFDTFEYQFEIQKKYQLKPIYFILFADYGTNDKNIPTHSRIFKELVRWIADHAEVGIHPSFTSNSVPGKLKKEIKLLSKTLHSEITKSRQHFLILHLPNTYRELINHGITDDYSMGYAAQIGFRASTCTSFLFYDLEMEYTTSLRLHPFAAMEGSLRDYNSLNTEEAMKEYQDIIDRIKAVGGTYISIWHNESLSDQKRWKGWRNLYEKMIEYALP